ncbi:response regulator transcription factor [Microbacterium sp.]|uniref:response regulator transcription factor n=1 Tax=Microbacterium sp. TaxID=51671 RepID=UPI003C78C557
MSLPHPRVIVVDDALLVREGIRHILEVGGCSVVGVAGDADELAKALHTTQGVDALVLDIRMPPTFTDEGLRALEEMRSRGDEIGVVILSMYASRALAERVAAAGAGTAYLLKDRVTESATLAEAVRTVATGGTVIDPEVVELLLRSPASGRGVLTRQEQRVLALMAEGLSNAGIARRLSLSVKTVESHLANLTAKLGIDAGPDDHRRVLTVLRALGGAQR